MVVGVGSITFRIHQCRSLKEKRKVVLPRLTANRQQKMASTWWAAAIVIGIGYAKSQGKTPDDFARYWMGVVSKGWAGFKGKGPEVFCQMAYEQLATDDDYEMEILDASESVIEARRSLLQKGIVEFFGPIAGTSLEEFIRFEGKLLGGLAEFMGLEYEQHRKGDWIYFSVSEKKGSKKK